MGKLYTTVIKLEDYPEKFSSVEARDLSIKPTLYNEATGGLGLDVDFDQIEIVHVDTETHEDPPLELHVQWKINPLKQRQEPLF